MDLSGGPILEHDNNEGEGGGYSHFCLHAVAANGKEAGCLEGKFFHCKYHSES